MALSPKTRRTGPSVTWSDARLVRACLQNNEEAWAALIEKYKNLIYYIPFKYRASPEDAADIFQAVCLELFSQLSNLRKVNSLRSWLITVTSHKAYHWKQKQRRQAGLLSDTELDEEKLPSEANLGPETLEEIEHTQTIREAIAKLPIRCQEMVRLLFYEDPPRPYQEVAQRLGLATGSIGFIRGRCLKRLQKILAEAGL
jgi:RNA polymerase sigma factor (sigma-70 family)